MGAVIHDGVEVRGWPGDIRLRPAAAADHRCALVRHVLQFGCSEPRRTAHREQTFRGGAAPVIDLSSQFRAFVKLHDGGDGALFGGDHERFDQCQIRAEFNHLLETQQRVTQMVEHAEEQHDIEPAQFRRGEFGDIERPVFDARVEQCAGLEKRVEGHAIHRDDFRAAPLAFEAEPAVPGADIEDAPAAQIFRQAEQAETPAKMLDGLEAREHAAVRQFDGVVTEARLDTLRELLYAIVEAAIAGCYAKLHRLSLTAGPP